MAGSEYKRNRREWYLCRGLWGISHGGRWLPDAVRHQSMASETTWLTHILYMTTDCHCVVVPLIYLSAAPQRDDIRLSLASNRNRCIHWCHEVIPAVAPLPAFTCDTVSCQGDVAFSHCARRRLAERAISTDNQRCPQVMAGQRPMVHRSERTWHISVLGGALRDVWQMHCGICKTGLLLLLFDTSVQIV